VKEKFSSRVVTAVDAREGFGVCVTRSQNSTGVCFHCLPFDCPHLSTLSPCGLAAFVDVDVLLSERHVQEVEFAR